MLRCKKCGAKLKTIDTRSYTLNNIEVNKRRKECRECKIRSNTYEIHEDDYMDIEKEIIRYGSLLHKAKIRLEQLMEGGE